MWEIVLTERVSTRQARKQPHSRRRQRGVTLVELIAAIVILGIALVGMTVAVSSAISRSSDTMLEVRAVALAQSYLDEILARRYDQASGVRGIPPCSSSASGLPACSASLGPEPGEEPVAPAYSRDGFNDVDDYHGLDEGYGTSRPLVDADGAERIGYDNFRVSVTVRYLEPGSGGADEGLGSGPDDLSDPEDAKLITVTVAHPEYPQGWQFSAYKANF